MEPTDGWIGVMNYEGECRKNFMSQLIQKLHSIIKIALPFWYQQCSIGSMKWWMRVMQYEGECIKNI